MTEWFEEWFGEEYLALYPHRDDAEADRAVALIRRTLPWRDRWRVLDVACGAGRHARAFEDAGVRCIGLDLSTALLRVARRTAGVPLVRADMRELPIRPGSMDLTVNLFTSFGYFETDVEHELALGEMVSTLRPGGWFVIDFLNSETVRHALVPRECQQVGSRTIEVTRELSEDGRFVTKTIRTGDGRDFLERVRLFGPGQIARMLEAYGITVRYSFGDYAGGPLAPGASRTILMGQAA